MTSYFIIPGLGNSGPQHWQTYFENAGPNFRRINQLEWETPDCHTWVQTIDQTLSMYDLSEVVLIGHSLGCAAIIHWAHKYRHVIKGAFLVAPSDIEDSRYDFPVKDFAPMPLEPLPFKSVVVASTNDPWVSIERAARFASAWGSELINLGDAGHINTASGYGEWEEGLVLLKKAFN